MRKTRLREDGKCKKPWRGTCLLFFLAALFLISCRRGSEHPIEFYYWKTHFSPTSAERDYFGELGCRKLYLRFFDVDKEGGFALPKAVIQPFEASCLETQYIPVVFSLYQVEDVNENIRFRKGIYRFTWTSASLL